MTWRHDRCRPARSLRPQRRDGPASPRRRSSAAVRGAARRTRPDRHQGRLRRRRLRRLHGPARRRAGLRLPGAARPGRRRAVAHGRGPCGAWPAVGACRRRSSRMARRNAASARRACWSRRRRFCRRTPRPDAERGRRTRSGGVLCRCTGYRKIIAAVMEPSRRSVPLAAACRPARRSAPGCRGSTAPPKVDGREKFGADELPGRCACAAGRPLAASSRPRSRSATLTPSWRITPASLRVLTARDVPGRNRFGVLSRLADQPVLPKARCASAARRWRHRRRARRRSTVLDLSRLSGRLGAAAALLGDVRRALGRGRPACIHAPARQRARPRPRRCAAMPRPPLPRTRIVVAEGMLRDRLRRARLYRAGGRLCPPGRRPHRGRRLHAVALHGPRRGRRGARPFADKVRIVPTAVGGGFGGKLDLSVQPLSWPRRAWMTGRPVRWSIRAANR